MVWGGITGVPLWLHIMDGAVAHSKSIERCFPLGIWSRFLGPVTIQCSPGVASLHAELTFLYASFSICSFVT